MSINRIRQVFEKSVLASVTIAFSFSTAIAADQAAGKRKKRDRKRHVSAVVVAPLSVAKILPAKPIIVEAAATTIGEKPSDLTSSTGMTANLGSPAQMSAGVVPTESGEGLAHSANTSATSIDTVAAPAKKKWNVSFLNIMEIPATNILNKEGAQGTKNTIGFGYKIDDKNSVAIKQGFSFKVPRFSGESALSRVEGDSMGFHLSDAYITHTNPKLIALPNDGAISLTTNLYLPTGEGSRFTHKQRGSLLLWANSSLPFAGKYSFNGSLMGRKFNNSGLANEYVTSHPSFGFDVGNMDYLVYAALEVGYDVTDKLNMSIGASHSKTWYKAVEAKEVAPWRDAQLGPYLGISYSFSPVSVSLNIFDDLNIYNPEDRPQKLFRSDEMTYTTTLSISL